MTQTNSHPVQPFEPANFADMIGTETVERAGGHARVRMAIKPRHLQGAGVVQGGALMMLADQAISGALGSLSPGLPIITIELKMNFIAPAREGVLTAEGRITHKGSLISVGEAAITDSSGKLIALAVGTWMTPRPPA
ncbi:MAG: PaaI family thioesterase [Chloroflexi bacterium]|nr:PaaI family thioesterase [Chloroflexota bacterium]